MDIEIDEALKELLIIIPHQSKETGFLYLMSKTAHPEG